MQSYIFRVLIASFLLFGFLGCGGGGGSSTSNSTSAGGSAQKGPFASGSVVKAYELVNGIRSGSVVQTTTSDYKGNFTFNSLPWSNPTQIVVTGYYFDEVTGHYRSDGNLSAVIKGGTGKIDGVNINVLTQITSARIIKLLKDGKTFDEAYAQANNLIKEKFNLDLPNGKGPESLDLTKTDKPDNAKLLQISAALLSTQDPKQVLEDIAEDAEDGDFDPKGEARVKEIKTKTKTVNLTEVAANIDLQTGSHMATHVEQMLQGQLPVDFDLKFIDKFDVNPNAQIRSNEVTLLGFDRNVSVEVVNARAMINNASIIHQGDIISVPVGSTVKLITIASSDYSTKKTATLKVNNKSFYFSTTTKSNPNSSTDTIPNNFDLGSKLNVEPSSDIQSQEIVVSGLSENTFVDVNITGGKYSVNGVNKNTTTSRVTNSDKIKVKITTSNQFSYMQKATLNIGGVSGDFITVTRDRDMTPNPFTIESKYNVDKNFQYITDYVTLDGFEGKLPLRVQNGKVQVEGDSSWNTKINSASRGVMVRFKQIAENDFDKRKTTAIKLGNYQTTFETITKANPALMDYVPTHINFPTKRVGVGNGETVSVESDALAITGIANGNGIKIKSGTTNAQIKINDGDWTSGVIEGVKAGDTLKVKVSNINNSTTFYGASVFYYDNDDNDYKSFAYFTVLTHKITQTPNDIDFTNLTNVNPNGTYFSNTVTISGLSQGVEVDATIVGNGTYSKNGTWESVHNTKNIKLKNGDTIQFKITLFDEPEGTTNTMFLNFKNKSFSFSVTTNKAPIFQTTPSFSTVEVGDHISFTPRVIDDSTLTFSLQNAPSWMDINTTTGKITGTVASGSFQDINLTATDSEGLSSSVLFSILANSAPTLTSSSFGHEYILDDKSTNPTHFTFSFKVSDDQTSAKDLNITTSHEITDSILPATGLNSGFTNSSLTCDMKGNCGLNIAFDFNRTDGLHPVLKTRHFVTVSDGDKNVTKYVDVIYEPSAPKLSGLNSLNYQVLTGQTVGYHSYITNSGGVPASWSTQNLPSWVTLDETTGMLHSLITSAQAGSYHDINITATNYRGSSSVVFDINVVAQKFQIQDFYGVELNHVYDSFITVDWLPSGTTAPISISGYEGQPTHTGYRVNGQDGVTTVQNGDIVEVWHFSSNNDNTQLKTTLTIGSDSDDFITKTKSSSSVKLPLIVGSPKTDANAHEAYSYTPQISSDTTHFAPVTHGFKIQNKPDWATFDETTGKLSGTPTSSGVYRYVKIIAYGDNGIDDITFNITVSNNPPSLSPEGQLSLNNPDLEFTFNDNPDWRGKITEVDYQSCMGGDADVLNSSDYDFSSGSLTLYVSSSTSTQLHTPSLGGARITIKADGYDDSLSDIGMVDDGTYAIKAELNTTSPLLESALNGAVVHLTLKNTLRFKDSTLDKYNFALTDAPDGLYIHSVSYIDQTHVDLTLSYYGNDFDTDRSMLIEIDSGELNSCDTVRTTTLPITAVVETPYIQVLYPSDPSENAHFGYSVADKNNTIAVGSYSGVYIYKKQDGNYTQVQKIAPINPENSYGFGESIAIDGDYLVIGDGSVKVDGKAQAGNVYVYKKGASGYSLVSTLSPADLEQYAHFGSAVDISHNMIIVGAYNALKAPDRGGRGKAYLYKNDGSDNFNLVETITRSNGKPFDQFGYDVAITNDSVETDKYYLVVGSNVYPDYIQSTNTTDLKTELGAGFANYYTYIGNTLSSSIIIQPTDSTNLNDHFGRSVSMHNYTVAIGGHNGIYFYKRASDTVGVDGKISTVATNGQNLEAVFRIDRKIVVAGARSYVFNSNGSEYDEYNSSMVGDNIGYSASIDGFEVVRGMYSNSDLATQGGAVLVTNAYENITSLTSSASTPPNVSAGSGTFSLDSQNIEFSFDSDDSWKNAITKVMYKAGATAQYVELSSGTDYEITSDNKIKLLISTSTNSALHTPYTSGSLLIKADGYLDKVVTITSMSDGAYGVRATLGSDNALDENNLNGATLHLTLSNTLSFADNTLDSANFTLIGAPNGCSISTITITDATHADITLSFDGTDFDDNTTLRVKVDLNELNIYSDVTSSSVNVEAIIETVANGTTLRAVDPNIVGARFWYDKNSNGTQEEFELSTYSDENGSFVFTTSLDEGGLITMIEAGLHNGREYKGNLKVDYNSSAPALVTPITTVAQKGFSLEEIKTILISQGMDSNLTTDELILDPFDSSIMPSDANMSTFTDAQLAKFRRVLVSNVAINTILSAQNAYGVTKSEIQSILTEVYSMGEGEGGGAPASTSLLGYLINISNTSLSNDNLRSFNAKAVARIYITISNYVYSVVKAYIEDYGSLDGGILYDLNNNISAKLSSIIEAMTNSYIDAFSSGLTDPKIEWVEVSESYRPLWMLTVNDMQEIFDDHIFNSIMIIYKDENGDNQKLEFDINHDYLENYQHHDQWTISNGKVLANGKQIELKGTKVVINGTEYLVIDVGSILPDGSLNNFYEEIPEFTHSSVSDGEKYVDINSTFKFDLNTSVVSQRLKSHTTCSLNQGYNGNVPVNISFSGYTITITPQNLLKHNSKYTLSCNISYGDDSQSKSINFTTEEQNIPVMITRQQHIYEVDGSVDDFDFDLKDDHYYNRGYVSQRLRDSTGYVTDSTSKLIYEDSGANTDTSNHASATLYCESLTLGGFSDWRLPTVNEMVALFRYDGVNDIDIFENLVSTNSMSNGYWTSQRNLISPAFNSSEYLFVAFPTLLYNTGEGNSKRKLCVRNYEENTTVLPDLTKAGDIVVDAKNSLEWSDDSGVNVGKSWRDAITYCENLTLDGKDDWRLPNINELLRTAGHNKNITDSRGETSLNKVFTATAYSETFWSSTTNPNQTNEAYILEGQNGNSNSFAKTSTHKTRCVRGGNEGDSPKIEWNTVNDGLENVSVDAHPHITLDRDLATDLQSKVECKLIDANGNIPFSLSFGNDYFDVVPDQDFDSSTQYNLKCSVYGHNGADHGSWTFTTQ